MRTLKLLALLSLGMLFAPYAHAQRIGVEVGVGPAFVGPPVCEYGYYNYYPYACAPYGYYGPEWFSGGVFIGAGPWFHGYGGRPGFYGRNDYGRGNFGRVPAPAARPAFRGGYDRGSAGGHFNGGSAQGSVRAGGGGGSFHGGSHAGGASRGGGRR
jgi:hypothetical protein